MIDNPYLMKMPPAPPNAARANIGLTKVAVNKHISGMGAVNNLGSGGENETNNTSIMELMHDLDVSNRNNNNGSPYVDQFMNVHHK